jgi:hypothetical protein
MRDANVRDKHGQAAVASETRRVPDAVNVVFRPRLFLLRPHAEAIEELLELAESYTHDNDRLRAECATSGAVVNKKRFARRSCDVLIRVLDCRCNRWKSGLAGRAAQAGMGKLEANSADWTTMHHRASCTGGVMWSGRW